MLEHLRLEAGQVPVRIERLTLGPVISTLAEMHEPPARLAKVEIIAVPTLLAVAGDRALLDRALGNLVVNALRHSHARRLLIGARRSADRVRIWVIDDGVGVPEIDLPRLFDDHFQGSNHGDEVRGGFGLGLASTRRLAALMQGSAGLDRRWTGGSAFWLELPAA
jgi:signal transduction histidine kinase